MACKLDDFVCSGISETNYLVMKRHFAIFLFVLRASLLAAQDDKITMSLGPAATDAKQAAIAIGLKLFDSYGTIMNSTQIVAGDKCYILNRRPGRLPVIQIK